MPKDQDKETMNRYHRELFSAVIGDIGGVCVVPQAIEEEVMAGALKKVHGEKQVFEAIKNGMSAQQAWEKFGIM